ncbi:hypothetical protein [Cellulomonas wangsupingiae]|uniref:VOC family protein n=1 Tax=Cellulomonas wangsupingiae TaxID=2968085 RepID=A0ABY5K7L3_9CELL|nr:hypothetical protein [Cellulomonas wangsupingiae]MCC2334580.1 hypothetical protein [Cellulomonas wangsupingiae]MCM0638699.1 hypothetical protein [Cellulomonas wangsupingiae]UUI66454.1 hypothetical protein NP075_07030 [Cellulomonas wangsupingiae]
MAQDLWGSASTVPALPCGDIDELCEFWVALGFEVTYRQLRPQPYLALRRGGVDLHYFGLDGIAPQDSYSTCLVLVDDTGAVFETLADGLRSRYARLPLTGFPRITRPRRRANAGGVTGFSLIDPAGNWVRFMRRPPPPDRAAPAAAGDSSRAAYAERPPDRLARALDDAVVQADSRGEPDQARKILAGALRRADDARDVDRVRALAFLAELAVRTQDDAAAGDLLDELAAVERTLDPGAAREVAQELTQAAELRADLAGR